MPVLKHAKKKLRQDKKRTLENRKVRDLLRSQIKKAKANPSPNTLRSAVKNIDKAAKKNIIHKNKAARLKSSLAKATSGEKTKETHEKKETPKKQEAAHKPAKSSSKASPKKKK